MEATWASVVQGKGKPRDKELKQIAQQLLECTLPLVYLSDFLKEQLPGEPSAVWIRMLKDSFNLITFLQNYIHQLRRENIIRSAAGQAAVVVTKKKKILEPIFEDGI